jgi:hypothetical protein
MKPTPFEYFAPTDITEALDLLARHGAEGKSLGGLEVNAQLAWRQLLHQQKGPTDAYRHVGGSNSSGVPATGSPYG